MANRRSRRWLLRYPRLENLGKHVNTREFEMEKKDFGTTTTPAEEAAVRAMAERMRANDTFKRFGSTLTRSEERALSKRNRKLKR